MHEKFAEGWRAATYVGGGLLSDFPGAMVEVSIEAGDRVERRVCRVQDAGRVIGELCRNFPRASVYYHPDSAYGFIAQVRCHCSHEKAPGCCRAQGHERARVLVVLQPTAEQDTPEFRAAIAEAARHDAAEQHKNSHDRAEAHRRRHGKHKHRDKDTARSLFDLFRR